MLKGHSNEEKAKRLAELVKTVARNPTHFAKQIGRPQGVVHKAMHQGIGVTPHLISFITNRYSDVNPAWLLYGAGEMFFSTESPSVEGEVRLLGAPPGGSSSPLMKAAWEFDDMRRKMGELEKDVMELKRELAELRGERGKPTEKPPGAV